MNRRSNLFNREPNWCEHIRGRQHGLNDAARSWLYEPGSLTQRLRQNYGADIAVSVLFLRQCRPFITESRQLALPPFRYNLCREVMLHHNGRPLLLARTIIPEETLKVAHRNLAHLGSRPLGEIIFSYPDLERASMDIAHVPVDAWQPAAAGSAAINQPVWGRRTVYVIHHRPLVISEFFLPELIA